MYTNTSCTLFLKSRNYDPLVIEKCFLTHRKIAASSKMGLQHQESAFVMFDSIADLIFTEGKDFLAEGVKSIPIDSSSDKKMAASIKRIQSEGCYTVYMADQKNFGSPRMRHWELSCK